MKLRTLVVVFSVFAALANSAAEARGFLDFIKIPSPASEKREYRPGSLNRDEALSLYTSAQRQRTFEACVDQFPGNQSLSLAFAPQGMKPLALCSDHFAVLYSQTSKTPLVVVERLNAALLQDAKGEERTNQFYPDPRIPKGSRAELKDYKGSNLDRGHQAPAGNAPDQRAMAQSFALSNMVPQDSTHNRKIWNKVENDVRKYARRAPGNVFVFTGPLFDEGFRTIGEGRVWVPTRLFKLIYDEGTRRAWAFVLENRGDVSVSRPMDYASFVKHTGMPLLGKLPISGSVGRPE